MREPVCEREAGMDDPPEIEDDVSSRQLLLGQPIALAKRLPAFSIGGYTTSFTTGLKKETERKEEERLREEKKWKVYREERERKTAMFVTPGLPPLAMAPDIDAEYLEWQLSSDLQVRRLFPNDPAKQCAIKDTQGEWVALSEYGDWLHKWVNDLHFRTHGMSSGELARCGFYEELLHEVNDDCSEVRNEYDTLKESATVLGLFEFRNLDKDGRTTALEAKLSKGDVIWQEHDPAVQAAYKELWIKYPYLERYEKFFNLDKGTEELEEYLRGWKGENFFDDEPEEVKRKYGYLLDRLKAEGIWSDGSWKRTEHESQGTEDPASPGFSPTPSSGDEYESALEEEGTEGTEKPAKRRLPI